VFLVPSSAWWAYIDGESHRVIYALCSDLSLQAAVQFKQFSFVEAIGANSVRLETTSQTEDLCDVSASSHEDFESPVTPTEEHTRTFHSDSAEV
jgi:hypothetical protein